MAYSLGGLVVGGIALVGDSPALLALGLVRIFRDGGIAPGRAPVPELVEDAGTPAIFHITSLQRAEEWRVASLTASILLQAALMAVLLGSPTGAAAFTVFGSAVLMWHCMGGSASKEQPPKHSRRVVPRALGMTVLAMVFTAAGLLRYLAPDLWPGQLKGRRDLVAVVTSLFSNSDFESGPDTSPGETSEGAEGDQDRRSSDLRLELSDESFPGVILLPDSQPFMKVVPVLPALTGALFQGVEQDPLAIPFEGVYWYLMWPSRRPPANSVVTRGSPAVRTFRSTDLSRLTMEARHNFGSLLDVSCCGAIEVHITNADRFPGTVSLELVLVNTTLPDRPWQSLGRVAVSSVPQLDTHDRVVAVREVLVYPIPRDSKLQQFDEAALSFRLQSRRHELSAKMAIDRFILVPRRS